MKYRKKPIIVEAKRVQTHNLAEMAAWCGGVVYDENLRWDYGAGAAVLPDGSYAHIGYRDWGVIIPTIEGHMLARFGWWIIQGVQGEFYPCDPTVFDASYEPAEDAEVTP